MNDKDFSDSIHQIRLDTDITRVLKQTRRLAADFGRKDLAAELNAMEQRRFYMLRTLMQGHEVPDFKAEAEAAWQLVYRVVGALQHAQLAADLTTPFAIQLRFQELRPEENLESLFSDYLAESERLGTDTAALTDSRKRADLERIAADIFKHLWVNPPFDDEQYNLIESILTDESIASFDRRMWTAAIGLGNIPFTDMRRFDILLEVYRSTDASLSVIALCWLCMGLLWADRMPVELPIRKYLQAIMAIHPDDPALFLRECLRIDTSITYRKNRVPNQAEMMQKYQSLFGESVTDGQVDMDKLREKFEQSGALDSAQFDIMKRIEDGNRRGDDVFFDTFRPLRGFPFFNEISNWFRPFHTDASELADVTDGGGALLADTIRRVPMLPDGDKYAIILSLAQTPENMRAQALDSITAQFYSVIDSPEFGDNLQEPSEAPRRVLINTCLKDMFRFFKLSAFRYGRGTTDIGRIIYEGHFNRIIAEYSDNSEILGEIADILFDSSLFDYAAMYYEDAGGVSALSPDQAGRYVQCYFGSHDDQALVVFQDYLSVYPDSVAVLIRTATALREQDKIDDAEKYLTLALKHEPENIEALEVLADLYAARNMADKEIETRYQIDYLAESRNTANAARLAGCLVRNGEYDEAIAIYAAQPFEALGEEEELKFAITLWLSGKRNQSLAMLMQIKKDRALEPYLLLSRLQLAGDRLGDSFDESVNLLSEILSLNLSDSEFGKFL